MDLHPQVGFFSRLGVRCQEIDSLLCVGLDPHPDDLPEMTSDAVRDFCLRLVEATAESAAAFKPNSAFFEALGAPGIEVLQAVINAIPKEIPVILDAKRGDIASTARAYAQSVFGVMNASAVTVSPYLGRDSIEPFLAFPGRGVFLLCKTSNPGAADIQDLPLLPQPASSSPDRVFEAVADLALRINSTQPVDNLGLVVGATQPEALRRVRQIGPTIWILAPGVGAQGGDIQSALEAGLRSDGLGMLFPVSRQISRAADPRFAAGELRKEINQRRRNVSKRSGRMQTAPEKGPVTDSSLSLKENIAVSLLETGCVRFGIFKLKSGLESPIYIDLRILASFPALLAQVAWAYTHLLNGLRFDRIAALPYAALPIGTAVSLRSGWSMVYPRKESKQYGTRLEVEGVFHTGEQVVVVDDLTTTGGSKFEAIDKLKTAGLVIRDVVVLIDRQSGAAEALQEQGYTLHAIFTLTELLDIWEQSNVQMSGVTPQQIAAARAFILESPK